MIEKSADLHHVIADLRHEATKLDSDIDVIKIKIGELNVMQACQDYEGQKDEMFKGFASVTEKGKLLLGYCKEYEEYASDKEERELIVDTESGIEGFLKTVSTKQAEGVEKMIK